MADREPTTAASVVPERFRSTSAPMFAGLPYHWQPYSAPSTAPVLPWVGAGSHRLRARPVSWVRCVVAHTFALLHRRQTVTDSFPATAACTRCGDPVSDRTPNEGLTQRIVMTKTVTTWRLRFSRFRFRWLPDSPWDRVRESFTTLDLCDWCAGDVFLFAQGLPPRAAKPKEAKGA